MTSDELAGIHALCFETPRPWKAEEFESLHGSQGVFLHFLGEAFILGRTAGPETELLTLAVAPSSRRQGLGQKLIGLFENTARMNGTEQLFLEVNHSNTAAIALYLSAGYTESGMRKDYYASPTGQKSSAMVMTKHL